MLLVVFSCKQHDKN